ncbi:MAG: T9SS type A sorting domain-containing protein, partial [candidate division Zixibacteria bacterium]|nr:T9SS type A sorting domain-containing protein [candidate division Zixibacteria bacterium]
LKSVLDKAIPMGQILVDLDLQDIGLTNNETAVGFVDSVVGEFRDPVTGTEDWIEAAVFEDNQTGDDYFMLVNRRLLSSEDNEVTVYLDTSQLAGDWYYFVIDQSSFDTILVNEDSSFAFHAHLEPGEGYLYKVTRAELCGDMSGYVNGSFYVVGDITVEEDDTLSIGWATLAFKEIDNLASGVDTTKPEIIVKGTLILGHEMEAAPGFGIGSWYGIRVVDNGRLENLCGMVGDSYYIRDAYIGLSFEDNTTSAYLEGGCEVPDAGGDLIIEDCQAGGMYLCTEEIEFADAIWVPTERDSTHTPVIIRNIPEGYGIKFTGDNCPDFNWLMSIENCKYGFYVGGSDDMIHDVWINNDSVDNAYGIYHYSNSASPTLDLRHIIVTGVFNTMDYLYAKSKQNIYECLFHSSSDSTLTGIYASGLGKATMRRSAVGFAKTCIYAANGVSDFGLTTDSGWNSIVINRDDTSTRSVNFDGLGTLKAYGNYWGEPNGNGYRFEGSVGFEPFLEDGIEHSWVCDSIPAYFDACNMAQNYMPGDPQEKVATHAEEQQIPFEFSLSNSYPNPFNPSCRIDYSLARSCGVEIVVYNILGQRVRTLVNDERPAGPNTVIWDGKNEQGGDVASGLYFYKMRAADFTKIQKMMLLK